LPPEQTASTKGQMKKADQMKQHPSKGKKQKKKRPHPPKKKKKPPKNLFGFRGRGEGGIGGERT